MTFTCQTSYQACYNSLLANKAGRLTAKGVDTAWYKVSLVKGYNLLTTGIPLIIAQGNLIAVQPNADIATFSTSSEGDYACGAFNCASSTCDIDCSESPTGFRFGIKFYSITDTTYVQLAIPGNYATCGSYQLSAIATYYSNQANAIQQTKSSIINVYSPNGSNETCLFDSVPTSEILSTEATLVGGITAGPLLTTISLSLAAQMSAYYNALWSNTAFVLALLSSSTSNINGCLSNCSSAGFCKQNPTTYQYECNCVGYYAGSDCSSDIRPCSSSPCLNNATCDDFTSNSNLTSTEYVCNCLPNYYGSQCEYKLNLCINQTCSGNGLCIDLGSNTSCKCKMYFSGDFCEIESNELKTLKQIISMTTIIAYIVFALFTVMVLLCDCTSYMQGKFTPRMRQEVLLERRKITKLVYIN